MRTIAVIPAKGKSSRLQNKNSFEIWKRPMLFWAIKACKESTHSIETYVSTDDDTIAMLATSFGAQIIMRSNDLAEVPKQEVVRDALVKICTKMRSKPDIVISLQPNSPQISAKHLSAAIDMLMSRSLREVFSVNSDLVQNAAFRIMRTDYAMQRELSTHCGVFMCDLIDVHMIDDVIELERKGCPHTC